MVSGNRMQVGSSCGARPLVLLPTPGRMIPFQATAIHAGWPLPSLLHQHHHHRHRHCHRKLPRRLRRAWLSLEEAALLKGLSSLPCFLLNNVFVSSQACQEAGARSRSWKVCSWWPGRVGRPRILQLGRVTLSLIDPGQ